MQNLFDKIRGYDLKPFLWTTNGLLAGAAISIILMNTFYPKPKVIEVKTPQVIEKQVIVKVPVKLNIKDKQQIKCLADNAYYEAGNQTETGMIAVSNVVMNRTKHSDTFGKTPCSVINQKLEQHCQFSWVCIRKNTTHKDLTVYHKTYEIAQNVYLNNTSDVTNGATFYHAEYVDPDWSHNKKLIKTAKIGLHIFYKGV